MQQDIRSYATDHDGSELSVDEVKRVVRVGKLLIGTLTSEEISNLAESIDELGRDSAMTTIQ